MPTAIKPPFAPIEARPANEIPVGESWQYEPKWDGFCCIAFVDGTKVFLQSKAGRPLARYFPDIVAALGRLRAREFVLDGELAIPIGGRFSFDELQLRLHPAASRVAKLARAQPAIFIAFDLLSADRESHLMRTLRERRALLERFATQNLRSAKAIRLSPATTDVAIARKWLDQVGGDLDGVIAKQLDSPYRAGERDAMVKVKKIRTADCVVGGFRYATGAKILGSLLLGLYGDDGLLHHVGFTSAFKTNERRAMAKKFEALRKPPGFTGNAPGRPSRWSTYRQSGSDRSAEWEPADPKIVVEVAYDHFTGGRFRHGTKFLRWRPDKAPRQCTMEQVAQREGKSLALL